MRNFKKMIVHMSYTFIILHICIVTVQGNVDCNQAFSSLTNTDRQIEQYKSDGTFCSQVSQLLDDIMQWQQCTELKTQELLQAIWNKLASDCTSTLEEKDIDGPQHAEYICRKERCMITPEMKKQPEANLTDDEPIDFGLEPTNLLNNLLNAFKGLAGAMSGAGGTGQANVPSQVKANTESLMDRQLMAIGSLFISNASALEHMDARSVCQILNKLDLERALDCLEEQRNIMQCGEKIENLDAQRYRNICTPYCLSLTPGIDGECTSIQVNEHIEAITTAVITSKLTSNNEPVRVACNNIQTQLFDCYTRIFGCCEAVFQEIRLLYKNFVESSLGSESCPDVGSQVLLHENAECITHSPDVSTEGSSNNSSIESGTTPDDVEFDITTAATNETKTATGIQHYVARSWLLLELFLLLHIYFS